MVPMAAAIGGALQARLGPATGGPIDVNAVPGAEDGGGAAPVAAAPAAAPAGGCGQSRSRPRRDQPLPHLQQRRNASVRLHGNCRSCSVGSTWPTRRLTSTPRGATIRAAQNAPHDGQRSRYRPHTKRHRGQQPPSSAGGGAGSTTTTRRSTGTATCNHARANVLSRRALSARGRAAPLTPVCNRAGTQGTSLACGALIALAHGGSTRTIAQAASSARPSACRLHVMCRRSHARGRMGRPFLPTPAPFWLRRPAHLAASMPTHATKWRSRWGVPHQADLEKGTLVHPFLKAS